MRATARSLVAVVGLALVTLYLAVAHQQEPAEPAELRFGWFTRDDLNRLDMFDDSRRGAHLLLSRQDLPAEPQPVSAPTDPAAKSRSLP